MFKSFILVVLLIQSPFQVFGRTENRTGSMKIALTSSRSVVTRGLGNGLALRVVKDSSVNYRDFGWIVEVVELPRRENSKNLLFQNPTGSTADQSQVYSWHIGNPDFPNERSLRVKGYPLTVTIRLKKPVAAGSGANSKFVVGQLRITWKWEGENTEES